MMSGLCVFAIQVLSQEKVDEIKPDTHLEVDHAPQALTNLTQPQGE